MIPKLFKFLKKFIYIDDRIRCRSGVHFTAENGRITNIERKFHCLEQRREGEKFHWYQHILCLEERLYWYEWSLTKFFYPKFWKPLIPQFQFGYGLALSAFLLVLSHPKMVHVIPAVIGAIAFNSTGTAGAPTDESSFSVSMTNTAGTFLMAPFTCNASTAPTVNSYKYNNVSLSVVASSSITDATNSHHAEWWSLASPATGANTLALTLSASQFKVNGGIDTFTGVNTTGAVVTGTHANVAGSSFSDSITTTAANSWVVTCINFGQHSATVADTVTSGNTRYAYAANQGGGMGDFSTGGAAGAYNVGWQSTVSYGGVADFVQSLVELTPSGGVSTAIKSQSLGATTWSWAI